MPCVLEYRIEEAQVLLYYHFSLYESTYWVSIVTKECWREEDMIVYLVAQWRSMSLARQQD